MPAEQEGLCSLWQVETSNTEAERLFVQPGGSFDLDLDDLIGKSLRMSVAGGCM